MVRYDALAASATLMAVGIGLHAVGPDRHGADRRRTFLVAAMLCYSLTATLLIFAFFPTSSASGTVVGFSFTGAAGFALVAWALAVRWVAPLERAEDTARTVRALRAQIQTLRAARREPRPLDGLTRYGYGLSWNHHVTVGLLAGDLRCVRGIDVWVSSENTHMQMSRPMEGTVSGVVRYLGAVLDVAGRIERDTIEAELRAAVGDRAPVAPGTTIVTGPGTLGETHGVRALLHVAAVEGTPGAGYRQVSDVGRCAAGVLTAMDRLNRDGPVATSVVVPLLGTGVSGADPYPTAASLAAAIIDHFRWHDDCAVTGVYLIARTDTHRDTCRLVLDSHPQLRARPPTSPQPSGEGHDRTARCRSSDR